MEFLKKVMITGIHGQDGTLLSELLLSQGIQVFGFSRPNSIEPRTKSGNKVTPKFSEFEVDLSSFEKCLEAVTFLKPDTIYHLAAEHAPSHIMTDPAWAYKKSLMHKTHVQITENLAQSIVETNSQIQLIVAGSSRMYRAENRNLEVNETTPVNPIDYYGTTKAEAWDVLRHFRNEYGLKTKMAILFNHESRLRRPGFLFRDIASQIRMYIAGEQKCLLLRDPEFRGDWHVAKDTVAGLQLMAENSDIDDLVLASGELIPIKKLVEDYFAEFQTKATPLIMPINQTNESAVDYNLVGDISLAEKYGWKRACTLSEVLHQLVTNESPLY
jgi:GDPmannose 4,6-dehydratase